ncbi:hypothetical protein Acr_13g0006110 [Actinidia rufa]|uniref:Uncharacterized protein n=1 Tax=Actinidia rufa TaxID=165716 RepID=A0A7J0FKK1_9ERIC|nr:hypothetical protein Acr_13g0006110 [Actinidia rufa]
MPKRLPQFSLSKAAKVLSSFVAAETGTCDAVSAYLRRASASFNELVQFHKDLKHSKSDRKLKSANSEGPVKYEKKSELEDSGGSYSARKKKKKSEDVEREGGGSVVAEEGNRKKRKNVEGNDDSEDRSSLKKKKKRRRIKGEED